MPTFAACEEPTWCQLTLFAGAFPASRTALLADVPAPTTSATSGRSSPDSFASLNPDGSWRKTCQGYSQATLDGSLERFSETWPRAGMTRSGTAYRLVPSAPLTDATASGSWPTPNTLDAIQGRTPEHLARQRLNGHWGKNLNTGNLRDAVMWPTPCAADAKNVPYQKGDHGVRYPMLLGAVAPERMWPTPDANMGTGGRTFAPGTVTETGKDLRTGRKRSVPLNAAVSWPTPTSITDSGGAAMCKWGGSGARAKLRAMTSPEELNGALNPTWVEWLMGYPLEWTACAAWATRSSRRSRSGSSGGSRTRTGE